MSSTHPTRLLLIAGRIPLREEVRLLCPSRLLVCGARVHMDMRAAVTLETGDLLMIRQTVLQSTCLSDVDGSPTVRRRLLCEDVIPWGILERSTDRVDPVLVLLPGCARLHDRLFCHLLAPCLIGSVCCCGACPERSRRVSSAPPWDTVDAPNTAHRAVAPGACCSREIGSLSQAGMGRPITGHGALILGSIFRQELDNFRVAPLCGDAQRCMVLAGGMYLGIHIRRCLQQDLDYISVAIYCSHE